MIYVDDMKAKYGRMIMSHMIASSEEELHCMAKKIGIARRWHQKSGTCHSHYDVCQKARGAAVALGATEISRHELGLLLRYRRATGLQGTLEQASAWNASSKAIQSTTNYQVTGPIAADTFSSNFNPGKY